MIPAAMSVNALAQLLRNVVADPESYLQNAQVIAALRTQGTLASYSDPALGIEPCALNTQKVAARDNYDGGYVDFDLLRRDAKAAVDRALSQKNEGARTTRWQAAERCRDLRVRWRTAMEYNVLLTGLLNEAISKADLLAEEAGGDARGRWLKERRALTAQLRRPTEGSVQRRRQ